jgi:hypothetical protein
MSGMTCKLIHSLKKDVKVEHRPAAVTAINMLSVPTTIEVAQLVECLTLDRNIQLSAEESHFS